MSLLRPRLGPASQTTREGGEVDRHCWAGPEEKGGTAEAPGNRTVGTPETYLERQELAAEAEGGRLSENAYETQEYAERPGPEAERRNQADVVEFEGNHVPDLGAVPAPQERRQTGTVAEQGASGEPPAPAQEREEVQDKGEQFPPGEAGPVHLRPLITIIM